MDSSKREIQEIINEEERRASYFKQIRKDFKKDPQKTIDYIRHSKRSVDAGYAYDGVEGVARFFQNLRETNKTDLDFVGNYLADNEDVLKLFTQINLEISTKIINKEREQEDKVDKKPLLIRYLDNYLKTFNFPHDVEKITKLVETFNNNYYKYPNSNDKKQTLEEIYQKTFDTISENKTLQVADTVIGYEIVDKTLTDKVLLDLSLLNEVTSGKFPKNDVVEVTNQNGNKVRIQFNKPNFASRLLGKETTVKIQSVCEEGVPPTTEHLKFVEQIANSFKLPKNPIKKDYKDASKLIKEAYEKAQSNSFVISSRKPEVVNDVCAITPSSATKMQEGIKESIIELVRTEILKQQRSVLQQYLAEHFPNRIDEFDNDKKLQVFLENPANKALIEQATQATKADLEKIEISNYKKIHEKCRDRLQPLKWEGSENVKENIIRNDAGEEICTLTQTTHNTKPFTVTKQDGTEVHG